MTEPTHLQFKCFRCSGQGCGYCGGTGRLTRPNTLDLRDYLAKTEQDGNADALAAKLLAALEAEDPDGVIKTEDGLTTLDGKFDLTRVARRMLERET